MAEFFAKRTLQAIIALLLVSVIVFLGVFAIGSPADILVSPNASEAEIERATKAFGLDKPLWEQYWLFLTNALQGDLGRSFVFNQPSLSLILQRFPATLELACVAMAIALAVGIPAGVYAGVRPEAPGARILMGTSIIGFSVPGFWVGMMLILIFAVTLGWAPSTGRGETVEVLGIETSLLTADGWAHIILPAINLSTYKMALVMRLTRAGVKEVVRNDYVLFARAKGIHPLRILMVHVMKNVSIPLITIIGLEFGSMLALTVVTETVFSWPGMGKLMIDSLNALDRPVVVAYLMLTVCIFIFLNTAVDLLYSVLDPRVRLVSGAAR